VTDLDMASGATAHVDAAEFVFAPGHAVNLEGGQITGSLISNARSTGLFLYANAEALNNTITLNGTAGITVKGNGNRIEYNNLIKNRYEMTDGSGGGQLNLEPESIGAVVAENVIDGQDWVAYSNVDIDGCHFPYDNQLVSGVEGYGTNHQLFNNEITRNSSVGIGFGGSDGITISSTDPECPTCPPRYVRNNVNPLPGGTARGIWVYFSGNGPNTNMTLDHVRSMDNNGAAVYLQDTVTGVGYTNGACLSAPAPHPLYVPADVQDLGNVSLTNPFPQDNSCP